MFIGSLAMLIYYIVIMHRFKWVDYIAEQKCVVCVLLCCAVVVCAVMSVV